jgi:hypothetical protein
MPRVKAMHSLDPASAPAADTVPEVKETEPAPKRVKVLIRVCALPRHGDERPRSVSGKWLVDEPDVRKALRATVEAENQKAGAGTHWIEVKTVSPRTHRGEEPARTISD